MKKICLFGAAALIAACAPTEDSARSAPRNFSDSSNAGMQLNYMVAGACLAHHAREATGVAPTQSSLMAAEPQCRKEIDKAVKGIAERTRRDNGWRSLHPSVEPALRTGFTERLITELARAY